MCKINYFKNGVSNFAMVKEIYIYIYIYVPMTTPPPPSPLLPKKEKSQNINIKRKKLKLIRSNNYQVLLLLITNNYIKIYHHNSPAYLMCKDPCHNNVIIATQNTSNITSFLPLTHLNIIRSQVYSMAS